MMNEINDIFLTTECLENEEVNPEKKDNDFHESLSYEIDKTYFTTSTTTVVKQEENDKQFKKRPFTSQEDKALLSLVNSIGEKNWQTVSIMMKQMNFDRNGRQCRDRYYHYLDPKINTDNDWLQEEDDLLLKIVEQNGKKWKCMEKIFPGRTEVSLRNRYHLILRKKRKNENKNFHCLVTSKFFNRTSNQKALKFSNQNFLKPKLVNQFVNKKITDSRQNDEQNKNLQINDNPVLQNIFDDVDFIEFDDDFNTSIFI